MGTCSTQAGGGTACTACERIVLGVGLGPGFEGLELPSCRMGESWGQG